MTCMIQSRHHIAGWAEVIIAVQRRLRLGAEIQLCPRVAKAIADEFYHLADGTGSHLRRFVDGYRVSRDEVLDDIQYAIYSGRWPGSPMLTNYLVSFVSAWRR